MAQRAVTMTVTRRLIGGPDRGVVLDVVVAGDRPEVVLLPAAMRGAADFGDLQSRLLKEGFESVAINLRGAAGSRGDVVGVTLETLAGDVAMVVDALCRPPVHIVGHALGNVIARATASYRPEIVATVTAMPCGGEPAPVSHKVQPDVQVALGECANLSLSSELRRRAIERAFFAPGNDATPWLDDWWPETSALADAIARAPSDDWRAAGTVPVLVLQAAHDALLPPEVGRATAASLGDRVTYREIPQAGHALIPEQPDLVAHHLVSFLRANAPSARARKRERCDDS